MKKMKQKKNINNINKYFEEMCDKENKKYLPSIKRSKKFIYS